MVLGYGVHFTKVWLEASPCDRADMPDFNPFEYKNPEALSDQELACLIAQSDFPRDKHEWVFKTIYCESSKRPYAVKTVNGVSHHGLGMISDLNLDLLEIPDHRILYNPERNLHYMYKLYKIRKKQPWYTDSTKAVCMEEGPNMDGEEKNGIMVRDGWEWARPTFETYFESNLMNKVQEIFASL